MSTQQQMPTWEQVHAAIARLGHERGEWAGIPMPVKGMRMTIHKSYPFSGDFARTFMPEEQPPSVHACTDRDLDIEERNHWASYKDGRGISIYRDGKQFHYCYSTRQNAATMIINTIGAARAWDFNAELRAMETLKRHVTEWAFQCYVMTGTFLETSKRSGVCYMFRRLRPTIAMTGNPGFGGRGSGQMRIMCTLCLHPVGYYDDSFAGALVPTDDVVSHLLLMRSDEHAFWKDSNQHPAWAPESAL